MAAAGTGDNKKTDDTKKEGELLPGFNLNGTAWTIDEPKSDSLEPYMVGGGGRRGGTDAHLMCNRTAKPSADSVWSVLYLSPIDECNMM